MASTELERTEVERDAIRHVAAAITLCETLGLTLATCYLQLGLDTLTQMPLNERTLKGKIISH
jgi:hypothetical protein